MAEPSLPEVYEIEGEIFEIDPELTRFINAGTPAILTGCRHDKQVMKQDRLFLVSDADGGVYEGCSCGMGLYREDTRFVNRLVFRLEGMQPTLLAGSTERTNMGHIDFVNPPLQLADGSTVRQETLHLTMQRAIADVFREQLRIFNFSAQDVTLSVSLEILADFADIFEVRGLHREGHGTYFRPKYTDSTLSLVYLGTDKLLRQTRIRFERPPDDVTPMPHTHGAIGSVARWQVTIPANGGSTTLGYRIEALEGNAPSAPMPSFDTFVQEVSKLGRPRDLIPVRLRTDHAVFNLVLDRCERDLAALLSHFPTGPFIAAGIPWFTSPFGRDALITALQVVWLWPDLARGVLRYMARYQGRNEDAFKDEQPGKMLHEARFGELARLGLIPHSPYYGTVDATPLWIILLSETYRWTGDVELVQELWDHLEGALLWLETYGDLDGDGFVEYESQSSKGIRNQGWKDSFNAILFPDGQLAQAPISLVEVQSYVYDAKRRAAELCHLVGQELLAKRLLREASDLKEAFNATFWSETDKFYALALDRDKRLVMTVTSNPGHCLWSEILPNDRVPLVVERLMRPDMFSGWGIRTLSAASPVYNPVGYHIGTVWPHDNSLIAAGMASKGYKREANQIFNALFDAALYFTYYRLPELFCGFQRQGDLDRPIPYPVACSPQAWAAGTPLLLVQSALGLEADAQHHTLKVQHPVLPPWLNEVTLTGLRVGEARVDLVFVNVNGNTTTRIVDKTGDVRVLIEG
ncbi:MAG TPA: amylo-alpha-1,6-glucosidase [Stenomitos sp.]